MKNVMTRAWEIAKEGVKKFGGKVKEYFAQALVMAWKETKEMVNLIGSEKQVKWASDIKPFIIVNLEKVQQTVVFKNMPVNPGMEEQAKVVINNIQSNVTKMIEAVKNEVKASDIINIRNLHSNESDLATACKVYKVDYKSLAEAFAVTRQLTK